MCLMPVADQCSKPEPLENLLITAFLLVCCPKLFSVHLISCGYLPLEVIQVILELVVKRADDLNLIIFHNW
jgi:hypothetical protein